MMYSQKWLLSLLLVAGTVVFVLLPSNQSNSPPREKKSSPNDKTEASFFESVDPSTMSFKEFEKSLQYDRVNLTMANYQRSYLIQRPPEGVCDGVEMVVYIMSMADEKSYKQREAIRNQIKEQNLTHSIIVRFFLGKLEDFRVDLIVPEIREFNDLVYYNVREFYRDNFIKWHSMHFWHSQYCPQVPYFLKLDDDTSVYFPRLFYWIGKNFDGRTTNLDKYFLCPEMRGFRPVRDRNNVRWYISRLEWPRTYWPTYCYGYFVLTTNKTVDILLNTTKETKLLHMDDVMFTGVMAEKADIPVVHFPGVVPRIAQDRHCGSGRVPLRIAVHNSKTPLRWRYDAARIRRTYCV
ncbi:unnamed protein product [Bursaphelenchus xylophilus]|uniref:Hexosyltransferase n=1 Tax=Bursaphelenchus xylophilus TaxID=6326 RepID=A0A1I7S676_BURXY|nr:unnamed protein product [Bursaphelenchus xylophilus]CAG9081083.1 unnamed protein product [Bursaphelenchus xylophilus]